MEREALKLALKALESNKRNHRYCEDTWYSCPKHEDGCANDAEGDECNCDADDINAELDKAITAIKEALAQPAQEPTGMLHIERLDKWLDASLKERKQREWVGLTAEEIDVLDEATWDEDHKTWGIHDFARAIERALKEKNNGT